MERLWRQWHFLKARVQKAGRFPPALGLSGALSREHCPGRTAAGPWCSRQELCESEEAVYTCFPQLEHEAPETYPEAC